MFTPQYITDNEGNKLSIVLPIKEYERIIEKIEELKDTHLYDEAKARQEPLIPLDKALKLIEKRSKKK